MMTAALNTKMPESPTKPGLPGFIVEPYDGSLYSIRFTGRLPLGWAGHLSLGLSSAGINITSGNARIVGGGLWYGEFTVKPLDPGLNPEEIDYQGIISEGIRVGASNVFKPAIEKYRLTECNQGTGELFLDVEGSDSLGFLAGIFKTFTLYSLFPRDMLIMTVGGKVHDRIHFSGIGGQIPSEGIIPAVRKQLDQLVREHLEH